MTGYDEGQVTGFLDDAVSLYQTAHAAINPYALIWACRMQFDAVTLGYPAARSKHLHALWQQLGQHGSEPVVIAIPTDPQPPNIQTRDRAAVLLRVQWWLRHAGGPASDADLWMGYIFDTAGEGHDTGWTADDYWADKIMAGDGYTNRRP